MSYEYDVFISYKSGIVYGRWVLEIFYELFKEYLDQSLGRPSNIFIDKSNIYDGDSWPVKIKRALATSKCVVAVLSPMYFNSEWCKRECAAILHREKQLGFRSLQNPTGLLSAVILHDGDKFPKIVQDEIQCRKWHDYARVGEGFEKTILFVQLQDELRSYADNIAEIVKRAPDFSNDWLSDNWLDIPYQQFELDLINPEHSQPTL